MQLLITDFVYNVHEPHNVINAYGGDFIFHKMHVFKVYFNSEGWLG